MADGNPIRYNVHAYREHKHTTEKALTVALPRELVTTCKDLARKNSHFTRPLSAKQIVEMAVREYLARIRNGRVKL